MVHDSSSRPAKKRLVVLVSGNGTNLQAILDAAHEERLDAEVCLVISNRPQAAAVERAAGMGIPTVVVDHLTYASRDAFDRAMMDEIDGRQPDLVVLAGFMRILTNGFVQHYAGRLINIHPSLLPLHQGLNTHQRALDAGDKRHGASVHFVTADLDGGPVILQGEVPVLPGDTAAVLAARVLPQEHVIYPTALQWLCDDRLRLQDGAVFLDGKLLAKQGIIFNSPA